MKHLRTDWSHVLTWLLLPLIAIALFYVSQNTTYRYAPRQLPASAYRMTPQQTIRLSRSSKAPEHVGFGDLSGKKLSNLVARMEAASEWLTTNAPPVPAIEITPAQPVPAAVPVAEPAMRSNILLDKLEHPGGLAVHPENGNLFVSESAADRITVLNSRGRRRVAVAGRKLLTDMTGPAPAKLSPLTRPAGLAVDSEGALLVVEAVARGRLLRMQCDQAGRVKSASLIKVPGAWDHIAWRSVAAGPGGALLLGGSTAEKLLTEGALPLGVMLYRDSAGEWWTLIHRNGSAIAGVAFAPDGELAVYVDGEQGSIGWIDLTTHEMREGASSYTALAPVGMAIMPDGRLVVAESAGKLALVDPQGRTSRVLADRMGRLSCVAWDSATQSLLAGSPEKGALLSLPSETPWPTRGNALASAPLEVEGAIRHVPERIPNFLAPLLDLGLPGLTNDAGQADLARLTRRVPLMAADSRVTLLHATEDVPDPVVQVVFAAIAPNSLMNDEFDQEFPISALILRTRSGQIYRSKLTRMSVLAGNLATAKFKNLGSFDMPIPFAYQARISPRGHAVIYFAGLGHSPDAAIALNPERPEESYMVLSHMTGVIEQYQLHPAADGSLDNWIISLPPRRAEAWTSLEDPLPGPGG